jgi:hypothetical protein
MIGGLQNDDILGLFDGGLIQMGVKVALIEGGAQNLSEPGVTAARFLS